MKYGESIFTQASEMVASLVEGRQDREGLTFVFLKPNYDECLLSELSNLTWSNLDVRFLTLVCLNRRWWSVVRCYKTYKTYFCFVWEGSNEMVVVVVVLTQDGGGDDWVLIIKDNQ